MAINTTAQRPARAEEQRTGLGKPAEPSKPIWELTMSKHMGLQTRSKGVRSLGWCAAAVMMGAPLGAFAFSLQDFSIGAGIRANPKYFLLFEKLLNVVHELAPKARIGFNTKPTDTVEAVQRWL